MSREVYIFRIVCIYLGIVAAFASLSAHVYRIQVTQHDELLAKAKTVYTTSKTHRGTRGSIFDRGGNLLVGNLACTDIYAEPRRIPDEREPYLIATLSQMLEVEEGTLKDRFSSGQIEVVIKKKVPMKTASMLAGLNLPGLRFVNGEKRYNPKRQLLANTLGFTDTDNVGVYGLEKVYDAMLAPQSDKEVFERSRKGQMIHNKPPTEAPLLDGKSLYLTIDEPIQDIMEVELQAMAQEHAPVRAYAIMADPKTGAVLGMAQWPSFDPNRREDMAPGAWLNRMISDVYDPGSTMKGVSIAGALDYGVTTPGTRFYCEKGHWVYAKRALRDSHPHEWLSVDEIIQQSSNIGTAKIALEMGSGRLYQTLRRFGFGELTGIGLPHESRGILRRPEKWDSLSITRFPMGHGISATPMQMVQAYCALANQGQMMQLHLISKIYDPNTGIEQVTVPTLKNIAIRPKAAREIVHALGLVTQEGGTATNAAIKGFDVAGKTGTSQKCINGSYEGHKKYVSSFIGFIPANDPAFVLLVIADEPGNGKYYGGTVCGPVFRRIAEQTLKYLNVTPTNPQDLINETAGG